MRMSCVHVRGCLLQMDGKQQSFEGCIFVLMAKRQFSTIINTICLIFSFFSEIVTLMSSSVFFLKMLSK